MAKSRRRSKSKRKYTDAREVAKRQKAGKERPSLAIPRDVPMFRLEDAGKYVIDILPFEAKKNNPFADEGYLHYERTFWEHRAIGADGKSYACLAECFKSACPICEYRRELERSDDTDDTDLARTFRPKRRQLFNVMDVKDKAAGVQVWEFSYHNFGSLLNDVLDDDEEDHRRFWLAEEGEHVRLTAKKQKMPGYSFIEVTHVDFRDRKQQFDEEEILAKSYCLDDFIVEYSYEELKAIFLQSQGSIKEEEEEEEEAPKNKRASTKKRSWDEDEDDEDDDADVDDDEDEDDDVDDADVDDDEDDDVDEDEEEEEEERPKKRAKKSTKIKTEKVRPKKRRPTKDEDAELEDDEDDEDEDDEELPF